MSTGTIMDSTSNVLSVEEEVGVDEEFGEPITLADLLGSFDEDPAQAAARDIDWEEFFDGHDHRYGMIVADIAEGRSLSETMKRTRSQYAKMAQLKQKLAKELQEFLGEDAIADSLEAPAWRASLKATSERAACTADRRRW